LGAAIGFGHYTWGWHATVTLGTMAAAAASSKMLRLNAHQTAMALGISASLAGGTRQNFGTMTKPFHAGSAARNGVMAALLAQRGFTADEAILEGPMGFCKLFSGGAEYDIDRVTHGLGDPFDIVSPGVSMKPYPCCRLTHRCIDAILHLIGEHRPSPDDVDRVECRTSDAIPQILIHSQPKTGLEGKFSMQYCMAIAILDGEVGLRQFTDEKVLDPKAQALLKRVHFVHPQGVAPEETLSMPEAVTIRLRDGRELSHEVLVARGDPPNPMSEQELAAKYRDCASFVLSPQDTQLSLDMVSHLEELRDVTELMDLVCLRGQK
ncbi:MAG: MmgE/PrpD family protein, partial [Deltaproteobacteria bacterium]|nr:MmgE/PrpD family protein [Deltaproteobacteria bacterium]